jgi:hypothetical protein
MVFHIDKKILFGFSCCPKRVVSNIIRTQNLVKLYTSKSIFALCVFHYLGIHDDAFPLVYFSFNDDLKPDFKVFGNVLIFLTHNFLKKLYLTST